MIRTILRSLLLPMILAAAVLLSACQSGYSPESQSALNQPAVALAEAAGTSAPGAAEPTPISRRPLYQPGELVDYTAQPGDTLATLAIRFNTTVREILAANTFIPESATTMPPGMPMKIPIYYLPLWGSPYKILPDSLFVNGPAQVGFNTPEFVDGHPGWLRGYTTYAAGANRSGAGVVDLIAQAYSVSPRLLLALLEYQAGALSQPELPPEKQDYPLGYRSWDHKGLYLQLGWAANLLNNGYYGWRTGQFGSLVFRNGRMERFDPWQDAATVSLHNYFNQLMPTYEDFDRAISPDGLAKTYQELFGDPWQADQPHIPGSLTQPEFRLPFAPGDLWAFTGGPHTGWGRGEPLAALDFAPPGVTSGCFATEEWATAVASGVVVRSETGIVVLDLDGDGDERTGWDIFYLHLATDGRAALGAQLNAGDPLGHPSCEGGSSTGTHVHIARKFNGEWMPAAGLQGILAFNLDGWIAQNGNQVYQGTLRRFSQVITACECSNQPSFIKAEPR